MIPTLTLLSAAFVRAQDIVNTHGFEPGFYSTGALEGQASTPTGTWMRDNAGSSSATVETSIVLAGTQAVQVNRAANADTRWGVPVTGQPVQHFITINWDMRVQQTTGPANTFGPFFGSEAYGSNGANIALIGALGVDATTGELLYEAQDTGFITASGAVVPFGTWHNYAIELDYNIHTYSFYLDGVLQGMTGFVDQNNFAGGINNFTDGDISTFAAAGDSGSLALTGTAYFDNFLIRNGAFLVPEPSTYALTALGLAGLLLRHRRTR